MKVVCTACGWKGAKPSFGCLQVGAVIFLALFFIIPGILVAIYFDSQVKKCPNCGQAKLIPENSPVLRN